MHLIYNCTYNTTVPGKSVGVDLNERPMNHASEGHQHLGPVHAQLGVAHQAQLVHVVVHPIGPGQTLGQAVHETALGGGGSLRLKSCM